MRDYLIRCYYDGMTLAQACNFISASFGKEVKNRTIESVMKEIKQTGKTWE